MNWNFKTSTSITNKLPTNLNLQGQNMGYRFVYFVKGYNIPPTLVINNDQIWVYLVPTAGKWTWEGEGTKHIKVLGIEDKKQVTFKLFHQL